MTSTPPTGAAEPVPPAIERMRAIAREWDGAADQRAVFLSCYEMMTAAMLLAVGERGFGDPAWVNRLLDRFAEYYFDAVAAYDRDPATAPRAWQLAHDSCRDTDAWPLRRLLLGINANINYDLALTVAELLAREWADLTPEQRAVRLGDYRRVNDIIARTIDEVQDELLEPLMPVLRVVDIVMGAGDELIVSRVLVGWRDRAWDNAIQLVEAADADVRAAVVLGMEAEALRIAAGISMTGGPTSFLSLFR